MLRLGATVSSRRNKGLRRARRRLRAEFSGVRASFCASNRAGAGGRSSVKIDRKEMLAAAITMGAKRPEQRTNTTPEVCSGGNEGRFFVQ